MSFRNTIGRTALTNVQSYLTRYTRDQTKDYVRSALVYYGEIPFLYRVFDATNVRSAKEKSGYKVVCTLCSMLLGMFKPRVFTGSARNLPAPGHR